MACFYDILFVLMELTLLAVMPVYYNLGFTLLIKENVYCHGLLVLLAMPLVTPVLFQQTTCYEVSTYLTLACVKTMCPSSAS